MVGCETNTSWCRSASGFEDMLLCGSSRCSISVIISTWHKHRISYSFGWSILLSSYTLTGLSYYTDQLLLCSLGKYAAFCIKQCYFEASLKMRTLCAFVCESHYHNLQPIKKPEKCSIDGFDYHVLFGVLG